MGGKKKSLANRLAKMSDEERGRYLQRKADMEEEARRRKEQLISTFMKYKVKKEDGFSRLNLAKINQNWHQILRFNKCKEMKEDVENMKKSIDCVLDYKNRTIEKLLDELEMAEEQYSHNFNAHSTHIDQILDSHNEYMEVIKETFDEDLVKLLGDAKIEEDEILTKSNENQAHLKTIIYVQNVKAEKARGDNFQRFVRKKNELTSSFKIKLKAHVKSRERVSAAIWRQIASVVQSYVQQSDTRRLHLAELKTIDAESAREIAHDQERITRLEEDISALHQQFQDLKTASEEKLKILNKKLKIKTETFCTLRKEFKKDVQGDDKKIISLTSASNEILEILEKLKLKGSHITGLMQTCRKFETEKDKIQKFLPRVFEEEEFNEKEESEVVTKIVISAKSPPQSPPSKSANQREIENITRQFAALFDLDQFWEMFSRVQVEVQELKNEKKSVENESKEMRGMLRSVLEAQILIPSGQQSKMSTRVPSKSNGCRSAPLRRILI